jgi:hypothetical protein
MCLPCEQEQTDAERFLEYQCTESMSVVLHCPVLFAHNSDNKNQPPYPMKSPFFHLRFSPNIYLVLSSHLLRLPSDLNSRVPPPKFCVVTISPHASYICGGIEVVSYLNNMYRVTIKEIDNLILHNVESVYLCYSNCTIHAFFAAVNLAQCTYRNESCAEFFEIHGYTFGTNIKYANEIC